MVFPISISLCVYPIVHTQKDPVFCQPKKPPHKDLSRLASMVEIEGAFSNNVLFLSRKVDVFMNF